MWEVQGKIYFNLVFFDLESILFVLVNRILF